METFNPEQTNTAEKTAELNRTALKTVFDGYIKKRGVEQVTANYDLLEPLRNEPIGAEPSKPALTVQMPLAINSDTQVFMQALDTLTKAQQNFSKPVDLVVWANAKYVEGSKKDTTAEVAAQNYASLREQLSARGDQNGIRIRTALQVLPEAAATMPKLRANFMDAAAVDAVIRDLGYDYPNIWIDADTTGANKHVFQQIEDAVRSFKGLFVHPRATRYTIDWAAGQRLSEMDIATKAVAIREIMRRQAKRSYGWRGYTEESGLAFAIGTYLSVGGLDTETPPPGEAIYGESRDLEDKLWRRYEAIVNYRKEHGRNAPIPPEMYMAPAHLSERPDPEMTWNLWDADSYIALSGRRQHAIFELGGIAALDREDNGERYTLFSDIKPDAPQITHDVSTVANELMQRINKKERLAGQSSIEDIREQGSRLARINRAIVARCFDDQQEN